MKLFNVLILGGGVHGLCTAYQLSKLTKNIGIIEKFPFGHTQGSSHGKSRTIRSLYPDSLYVDLMQLARIFAWPQLERDLNTQIIFPNVGCIFGKGEQFEKYVAVAEKYNSGFFQLLDVQTGKNKFPQFHFPDTSSVLIDTTAGTIAAEKMQRQLLEYLREKNVELIQGTEVFEIISKNDFIEIKTNKNSFFAEKVVVALGPWISQLLPKFKEILSPIQQTVCYFKIQDRMLPNWSCIREDVFYGLPSFAGEGMKVAQHITKPSAGTIEAVRRFVGANFVFPIKELIKTEPCFYTNTPREDFLIDYLPEDNRIIISSICSGHGFKFAPLLAQFVAEKALHYPTKNEFCSAEKRFKSYKFE